MNKWAFPLILLLLVSTAKVAIGASEEVVRLNNDGVGFLKKNDYTSAIKSFTEALRIAPGYHLACENLCITYNNRGISRSEKDPKGALDDFIMSAYLDPENKTPQQNTVETMKALGKDPDDFKVRLQAAQSYLARNDYPRAIAEYRAALALKDDVDLRKKLAAVPPPVGLPDTRLATLPTSTLPRGLDFTNFMKDVQERIAREWRPPASFPTDGVTISFRVEEDGSITRAIVERESKSKTADETALKAIQELELVARPPIGPISASFKFEKVLGSNLENISINNLDFAGYMEEMQKQIKAAWLPPKTGRELTCEAAFDVLRNGAVDNIRLIKKSNHAEYDAAGLATLKRVKLHPLPSGSPPRVSVEFTFDYHVNRNSQAGKD